MPVSPDYPEYIRPRDCLHALTPARQVVVEVLHRCGDQAVDQLSRELRISASAVRQHLKFLMAQGLVEYVEALPQGRGRPRRLFRLTQRGESLFPTRSGDLALSLLSELAGQAPGLVEAAVERRVGQDTAWFNQQFQQLTGGATLRDLAEIYEDLEFSPTLEECGDGRALLVLAHCPVREVAAMAPRVCEIELEGIHQLLPQCIVKRVRHRLRGDSECAFVFERARAATGDRRRPAPAEQANAAG